MELQFFLVGRGFIVRRPEMHGTTRTVPEKRRAMAGEFQSIGSNRPVQINANPACVGALKRRAGGAGMQCAA
jgi:hypothetical protein